MSGIKNKRLISAIIIIIVTVFALQICAVGAKKKQSLKSIRQQIRSVRQKIKQKEGEKKTVLGRLAVTERVLNETQSSLSNNKLKLLKAQVDLDTTVTRLERTKRQLKRRETLLTSRVVDIYEGESLSYVNVVLGSSDMWTFLTRTYYLKRILNADASLIKQIKADKLVIEKAKAHQVRLVGEIGSRQARLESDRNEVAALYDSRQNQLSTIENSQDLYEKALNELEAASHRIEEQIRSYQRTPKGKRTYSRAFKGNLSWPCHGRITSRFGYRVHPVTGVYKLHTGCDISVPTGTSVCAAADGTVIAATWNDAYGYMVIIDHGGGISTLYGHNSRLMCRSGQEVRRGQIIARSGSTGYSTGPHVHFEKRINGTPVNPM